MYLHSIILENVGPIELLDIKLPFDGERPLPLVLVGKNGSGKTTLLSFIVNALLAFKQQIYDETEIEEDRVFRMRSGQFLRSGKNFYRAKLKFQEGLWMEEWVLSRSRDEFERSVVPLPSDDGWKTIAPEGFDKISMNPQTPSKLFRAESNPQLKKLFDENVALYFASDRFEPPAWMNLRNLAQELQFPDPVIMQGITARRIFSRSLLKPTLDWLQAVKLDAYTKEIGELPTLFSTLEGMRIVSVHQNPSSSIFATAERLLGTILGDPGSMAKISISGRPRRFMRATVTSKGHIIVDIPNLLSLSAGQSALFCLFCNIVRDADLAGISFSKTEDIRGIVLIDEVDLHLHLDLQFRVLPELIGMFPKVQFIITAHSPLVLMGMRKALSEDGFRIVELPSAERISTEAFSEFTDAFTAFTETRAFEKSMLQAVRATERPLLFVEGKHDKTHLEIAWRVLFPAILIPFEIYYCGDDGRGNDSGSGAKRVNQMLVDLAVFTRNAPSAGLFDNDSFGAAQFKGLMKKGFIQSTDKYHLQHASKNVHALLLPIPTGREKFVTENGEFKALELEHYYPDAFLKVHGAQDFIFDSTIFRIIAKAELARAAESAPSIVFAGFSGLFDFLLDKMQISIAPANV